MKSILSLLLFPKFEENQKNLETKVSYIIFITIIIGLTYMNVFNVYTSHFERNNRWLYILIEVVVAFLFFLNSWKKLKYPLVYSISITLALATTYLFTSNGTREEVLLAFPLLLFVASLTYNRKNLLIILIIELVIIWLVGILEITGFVKNNFSWATSFSQLFILSIIMISSAAIIDLLVSEIKIRNQEITEASKELKIFNDKLSESIKTKDKFFSIISHDLRSPFQGLLGIANILETLDDELTVEERKDFTSRLSSALKRQYDFLEELLLWSKFQRGLVDFEPTKCDLVTLVGRNCEIFNNNFLKKKISYSIDGENSHLINGDENLISTVIRNLLSNSIKFTQPGGKVKINIYDKDEFVKVVVNDNGIGIPQEKIKNIFETSAQSTTRGTEGETGSGLGLILCYEIMKKHSGEISVESEVGKGASFTIVFPKNIEYLTND